MKISDVIIDMHQGINTVADKVEYLDSGIPIIQSKNFTRGYLDLEDVRYLGEEDEKKYIEKYNPHVGDILMANIGTIGKSYVISEEQKFLIAWNAFLIKPNAEKVKSDFLKFYFDYLASTHYFDGLLTGGTVKFINKKKIGDINIPDKSLAEQSEICNVLSQVEKVIIQRQQEMELLDDLIKARFVELFGDAEKMIPLSSLCDVSGGYSFKSGDITSDGAVKILQIG
ncbi:MAG: restriction endonuclease subunit S, partial [Agathobacter sp.]|nr:restriction endonuclease subunit S [Agathobacter sp.]